MNRSEHSVRNTNSKASRATSAKSNAGEARVLKTGAVPKPKPKPSERPRREAKPAEARPAATEPTNPFRAADIAIDDANGIVKDAEGHIKNVAARLALLVMWSNKRFPGWSQDDAVSLALGETMGELGAAVDAIEGSFSNLHAVFDMLVDAIDARITPVIMDELNEYFAAEKALEKPVKSNG